ncbi:MAG: LLM class F420-dependent oxidoreductase [Gammaproteobacteria bacterium]|jgi:F420-dependent oxidoreductase-like protein|nr:LLM class F420-dependent oxidoreductase [Gammaproteobacteria bacterium]MBT5205142.1 LLM class F420-dependent oxidoreductase [Gammaproteobacteria bacterium]MBT5601482.1 LLM class F420-dependent oxidoreductase [Gammaproteobacteria bacterium]MBT6246978.1 LLM class F420-dependent oxidoreductase [Gammaproteobacteria bacterium]
MRFSLWPLPSQDFVTVRHLAEQVESTGWDGVWLADHFMPNAEDTSTPWPEAWTTLAGLAAVVPRIRLGTLVTGNTYRHPAILAKMAATVDHISQGRVVLGLGSGWQENEHQKYGIDFFSTSERLARLEEACQVIKALWGQAEATFEGKFYQLQAAPLEPKPVQKSLPLMIGGGGERVTLKITAQYADEWNVWGTVDTLRHKMTILDRHCEAVGRDPKDIQRSAVALMFLTDDDKFAARMRDNAQATIAGNRNQVRDIVGAYRDAGVDELIVPDFTMGEDKQEILDVLIEDVFSA